MLLAGFLLVVLAIALFAAGKGRATQYCGLPLAIWIGGAVLYLAGCCLIDRPAPAGIAPEASGGRRLEIGLLALIVAVGLGARVARLTSIPNGCQVDEASHGLDGGRFLSGAPYVPYMSKYGGRATLYPYMAGLSLRALGHGVTQLRMTSVALGTLTIAAFFFLARPLMGAAIALSMTALLAVSRWHITFSRIAFETILDPLATVLLLFFLLRSLRLGRARDWALTGLALAFGLNGYLAFRAAASAAFLFLGIELLRRRRREDAAGLTLLLGGLLAGVAPLAVYSIQNPAAVMGRTAVLSVNRDIQAAGGSLRPLLENFVKTVACLNVRGDASPINNLPGAPLLDPVTGVLVLLGLLWALFHWRDPMSRLVLIWTAAVGSLDVFSNASEAPSARRILGLLPVLLLAGGMGLKGVAGGLSARARRAMAAVVIGGLLFSALFNLDGYFLRQARDASVWRAFSVDASAPIGEFLRSLPAGTAFFYSSDSLTTRVVDFVSGHRPYAHLNFAEVFPPPGDAVYVLPDGEIAALLAGLCPSGRHQTHRDPWGEPTFFSFQADAGAQATCQPALLENGLVGRYFKGVGFSGRPQAVQRDPLIYANDLLPAPFTILWRGALAIPVEGIYKFRTFADDGALLFLDGALAVDNGGEHSASSRESWISLKRGFHSIELRYWQRGGAQRLDLFWQPPGRPESLLSPRFLFPAEDPGTLIKALPPLEDR